MEREDRIEGILTHFERQYLRALVGNAPLEDNLLACNLAVEYGTKAVRMTSLLLFAHV